MGVSHFNVLCSMFDFMHACIVFGHTLDIIKKLHFVYECYYINLIEIK